MWFWLGCAPTPSPPALPVGSVVGPSAERASISAHPPGAAVAPSDADSSVAGCRVTVDYDDDVDGTTDRWTELRYDDAGQWVLQELDDGTYTGRFRAFWRFGCRLREEGSLLDDDGTIWTVTATQDCDPHGAVTRRTEVWSGEMESGATVVYGDTTRWTWTWDGDHATEVVWTTNDGVTQHRQRWTWTTAPGPDTSEIDLADDGVIDETWAWTWEPDGDVATESQDGATTSYQRDIRDRLIETSVEGESLTRWTYGGFAHDHAERAETVDASGSPEATRTYAWSCDLNR